MSGSYLSCQVYITSRQRPYLEATRFTIRANRFTIEADHEALRWILTKADPTRKLTRCRLRLWELEFDIVYPASIKHRGADVLSHCKAKVESRTPLDGNVSVLIISQEVQRCAPQAEKTGFEFTEEPKAQSYHLFRKLT